MDLKLFGISARNDGFGIAGKKIMDSMERCGINNADEADVHLSFAQPHQFNYTGNYNIGYFPWESTLPLFKSWYDRLDRLDEIWVTSEWVRSVVSDWGYNANVYEHGIDKIWTPKRRVADDKVRFLFMGLEALRKGGLEAIRAFNVAFQGIDDVELILKTQESQMDSFLPKIRIVDHNMPEVELVRLFHDCHVFVAPTYGEGFGLPALDAAATGMPVIATRGFLPYEDLLDPQLLIDSTIIDSPWPTIHPGQVFKPDFDDLVDRYRYAYHNFSEVSEYAFDDAGRIHFYYDWDSITKQTFLALESRLL